MKKIIYLIILGIAVFITGCSNSSEKEDATVETSSSSYQENVEEQDNQDSIENLSSESEKQDNQDNTEYLNSESEKIDSEDQSNSSEKIEKESDKTTDNSEEVSKKDQESSKGSNSNKQENSYENYIGKWSYTIKYNEGEVGPGEEYYEVKITSIDKDKIVFDYTAYNQNGSVTLGTENSDIEATINDGQVEFDYRGYYNLVMNNYGGDTESATLYLDGGKLYLSTNNGDVHSSLNQQRLTKKR